MTYNRKPLILDKLNTVFKEENPIFPADEIKAVVSSYLERRDYYLDIINKNRIPFYLFEPQILKNKANIFMKTFRDVLPDTAFYFAMKCNNHPEISKEMINNGYGLDVSSGLELDQALSLGCEDIVFSGPGRTKA